MNRDSDPFSVGSCSNSCFGVVISQKILVIQTNNYEGKNMKLVGTENKDYEQKDETPLIIKRDIKMVEYMVEIYCKNIHDTKDPLCVECEEFLEYAKDRLQRCPYQEGKTACSKCGLVCYDSENKEKGTKIFTYSGPRMLYKNPKLAFHHMCDALKEPKKTKILRLSFVNINCCVCNIFTIMIFS